MRGSQAAARSLRIDAGLVERAQELRPETPVQPQMILLALPALILTMFGYMFWHAAYRMRRDRIAGQREARRSRFRLRGKRKGS